MRLLRDVTVGIVTAAVFLLIVACDPDPTDEATTEPTFDASPTIAHAETVTPAATESSLPPGLTEGRVTHVVDGDTIDVEIGGVPYTVRYIGIDTPETVAPAQPVGCFGPEASARNKALVEGMTVGLEKDVSETDRFGRLLRYVYVGSEMVNAALVRDGYALSSTYPPDVRHQETFVELQREAREAGRGLWGAVCASPTAAPPPVGGSGGCEFSPGGSPLIKGNINREGERIYHVPGQQYYDETVINEGNGERWFCTEADALNAGWRKSRV